MTSNKFTDRRPLIKSPSICRSLHEKLPPILPGDPPPDLGGYARWTDLDPLGPLDVSMAVLMPRVNDLWKWQGQTYVKETLFVITLDTTGPGGYATVTLGVWRTPDAYEGFAFDPVQLAPEPPWDTGPLTYVHLPGYDWREAQVAS